MIIPSGRAFFRVLRPWQITNSCDFFNFTEQFQGYHCHPGLNDINKRSFSKGLYCPMDWSKKRKTLNAIWRPVSSQSSFSKNQECYMENILNEPENIGSIEQSGHEKHVVSLVSSADDLAISSSVQAENEVHEAEAKADLGIADAAQVSTAYKEKLSVSVEVGASVMRFIRGKDGSMQKTIEEEMDVRIKFPTSKKEDSIVIGGDCMDAITKASEKIQAVIDEAVKSPTLNYSHFISLPLATHTELVEKLTRFQSTILGDSDSKGADQTMDVDLTEENSKDEEMNDKAKKAPEEAIKLKVADSSNIKVDMTDVPLVSYAPKISKSSDLGIDRSIFNKVKTFHLTVLMLKLWNKERIHAAMQVLQNVSSELAEVLGNRPLFVRLKGLNCMKGSPAKAQVLYIPVEEIGDEGRLLRACQIIIDAYVKAGLVLEKDKQQKLKLHATVMNTISRKGGKRSGLRLNVIQV
ncbi:uncharacterized protein LOC130806743 isoform X2 [Amaranthus tricolor]|uniref:uncharacterized protein LOC130806743 isoform X2 n=1 Tax=Amaranthus tricolor TaxID=29722 RepID=UPI00258369E0|nr:uncharacterized protein LOC130806743 isoform X2 [Amaranthus tricolor]